jgi:aryl-phospho-beta-D-glucosidase BglC (GH1 family)
MSRNFLGLRVDGDAVVGPDGARVLLRGVGLGGWMNMENFITGYPATESAMREAVAAVLGSEDFFDLLLDRFFGEADAQFLASLGVTCVRLPVNQKQFAREVGFARLERAVSVLGAAGIYSVIDLHAVAGGQNQHWHSDNPTHIAAFWLHEHFQDQVVALWEVLAARFVGNPWVAGYNLLNEPADPSGAVVGPFHDRLVAAIREIDPDHILFVDGNTYSTDFSAFGEPFANAIYACHDYAAAGMAFGDGRAVPEQLEAKFLERTAYQRETGTPIWVGEFGPVYTGVPELDDTRLEVLDAQLSLYERYGAGWSLWTYKDVGLQGLVYTSADSPYMQRFGEFIARKARLGIDSWGSTDRELPELVEPIHAFIAAEFPDWEPYPWNVRSSTDDLLRHILFAQAMLPTYAKLFADADDLDALADSFSLAHCVRRERLCELVASHTRGVSSAAG